jgi:outer membrane receptor protein involved in Fe transport
VVGVLLVHALKAQSVISGIVLDKASGLPIEYASLSLIHLPDSIVLSATATDKKGKYSIKDIAPGIYRVQCSFVGYDQAVTAVFNIGGETSRYTVPAILLAGEGRKMDKITVTGRRPTLNTSIDRKIYLVEQDIMSRSGSASDILKNIPSVEVDIEGNVNLRGSGDVMILINGKPSPLMGRTRAEVLQQLPANTIERIEVITNPSARYRPDGTSGIINIVLKKNIRNGFNGNVLATVGNRDRFNSGLSLNYRPGKFNLFGSYSYRQDTRRRYNFLERTYFDTLNGNNQSFFLQNNNSFSHPQTHIITAGLDYQISDRNSAGVSGNYFQRKQVRNDITNTQRYDELQVMVSDADRLRYDPESETERNGTAYFEHQFKKEDHEVRLEYNTSNENEVEDNHYTNIYIYPQNPTQLENTRISQRTRENQLEVDYTNPLTEDSKLEAGYDGVYNIVDLDFYGEQFNPVFQKFIRDAERSNRFIYNENIHAVYITYQKSFEKFGYSAGLRSEGAFTKGHLVTKDSFVTNNYFKIYPTLHLSYTLKENHELQLNYSKRVHRPEADELNPFPEYQDSLNLRAGNPALLPEIIHSVELGYKWQGRQVSFVPSVYYRVKKDGFTSVVVPLNDSVLLSTMQNLSHDQSAGLELIFSAKAGTWFTASWSTNVFYNQINASNLGYIRNRSIMSFSANANATFSFTKNTMLQLSSNYRSARLTPQGKTFPAVVVNAGIRQDFLKNKFSASFTMSDLFNSWHWKSEYDIPFLHQVSKGRRDGRIVNLGISYRFGVIKKPKEEKLQFDNSL